LTIDFTLFPNVVEIMDALKAERVKTKYSPDYHVKTLTLIKNQMPCTEPHQI